MPEPFFDRPILNSPYAYPRRHWELDEAGQPTQRIIDSRRSAKFITPIPKPKKRKAAAQAAFVFDEGKGLSTKEQRYVSWHCCVLPTVSAAFVSGFRRLICDGITPYRRSRAPAVLTFSSKKTAILTPSACATCHNVTIVGFRSPDSKPLT